MYFISSNEPKNKQTNKITKRKKNVDTIHLQNVETFQNQLNFLSHFSKESSYTCFKFIKLPISRDCFRLAFRLHTFRRLFWSTELC